MKRCVIALCAVLILCTSSFATVKNVIVLVPDGCDQAVQTAARWLKGAPLAVDGMNVSMARTHMANSIITGSAAAATAFACGEKTTVRFLGVGADPAKYDNLTGYSSVIAPYAPMESILEAAKNAGKATGLVSSSRVTHATPAAYGCHVDDRGDDNDIMEHLVYQNLNVVFGGAHRHLLPDQKRKDGENLEEVLKARGYAFVTTETELDALGADVTKAWGMFAMSHMDADIDRWKNNETEPSIAKMTRKALEILSKNENGFCIMIEGSQVDWAGHQNDPVWMITDFLAWDAAVQEALDFAAANGDTMVIAFPDHDTGSMSIGHNQGSGAANHYTETTIENLIDPIKDATISLNSVLDEMEAMECLSHAGVRDIMATYWGPWWADPNNMSDTVAQEIANQVNLLGAYGAGYPVAEYLSKECTYFGWSTHGHLGEDVPVWSYVNGDALPPEGVVDNTDLAHICAAAMGLELTGSAPWDEYDIDVLNTTNINENPIATLPNGDQYIMNTNIKIVNGQEVETMYISVFNTNPDGEPVGKVYIPKM